MAKHGRRLLSLLDTTPVVPGDMRPAYEHGAQARQILNDAEDDLRDWRPDTETYSELYESPSPISKGKEKEFVDAREVIAAPVDLKVQDGATSTTALKPAAEPSVV